MPKKSALSRYTMLEIYQIIVKHHNITAASKALGLNKAQQLRNYLKKYDFFIIFFLIT